MLVLLPVSLLNLATILAIWLTTSLWIRIIIWRLKQISNTCGLRSIDLRQLKSAFFPIRSSSRFGICLHEESQNLLLSVLESVRQLSFNIVFWTERGLSTAQFPRKVVLTRRVKIRNFVHCVLSGGKKIVILDEFDYVNANSMQPALRGFIEEFSDNCRFILTCNSRIESSSRFTRDVLVLTFASMKQTSERCVFHSWIGRSNSWGRGSLVWWACSCEVDSQAFAWLETNPKRVAEIFCRWWDWRWDSEWDWHLKISDLVSHKTKEYTRFARQ